MSTEHYEQLQKKTQLQNDFFGAVLPQLERVQMAITSEHLSTAELKAKINENTYSDRWVLYRDSLAVNSPIEDRDDLIEGELTDGERTLKFNMVGPDKYRVLLFAKGDAQNSEQYVRKSALIRIEKRAARQLQADKAMNAEYAILYTQEEGESGGRWRPFTQQFLGFRSAMEAN